MKPRQVNPETGDRNRMELELSVSRSIGLNASNARGQSHVQEVAADLRVKHRLCDLLIDE